LLLFLQKKKILSSVQGEPVQQSVLEIDDLSVSLTTRHGKLPAVEQVDLRIAPGKTLCLVGESGSGKTVTALSVMRLIDAKGGRITQGTIRLEGRNLAALTQRDMSELRGRRIGIVFQDPMTAFDPLFTVGGQIAEVVQRHQRVGRGKAFARAVELLASVHIPDPAARAKQHPHELSGGMLQRAMIAMALACGPSLLIADEPTTALDVTIQAQVLTLLRALQSENGMSILLITHDFGIAAEMADRVAVMYAGRIVEEDEVGAIFARPAHPYTRALLASIIGVMRPPGSRLEAIEGALPGLGDLPPGCRFHPRCQHASARCAVEQPAPTPTDTGHVACWHPYHEVLAGRLPAEPEAAQKEAAPRRAPTPTLLRAEALSKAYALGGAWFGPRAHVRAVDGVSLDIEQGETFGLVGESGSGKSTLGRLLLHLERPTSGRVFLDGVDLGALPATKLRAARRHMQVVFQDPYGSIDPRWSLGDIIAEPLEVHETLSKADRRARVQSLLAEVGLDPAWDSRFPHQLSGGQRQRVAIARAIALRPRFVLADEALSALDASVQAQVVNLLQDLKEKLGLTYLFIAHGLHVVRRLSDRVGVMYLGRLVEIGPAEDVFRHPAHPYTQALIAAIPAPDPTRRKEFLAIPGEIATARDRPAGCRFHPRCAFAVARCREEEPQLAPISDRRSVACHFPR
jgi:peptide/nickel transport system ATP-binding protein